MVLFFRIAVLAPLRVLSLPWTSTTTMSTTTTTARNASTVNKADDVLPADFNIPDNYVAHTLKTQKALPPITWDNWYNEINWLNFTILTVTPAMGLIGAMLTPLQWKTCLFSIFYYYLTGLGITAGYHRLWAHRSYNASRPLQYILAVLGAGAVEGSIKWWSRGHRAHHRYTDTDLDPYNAHRGFFYSHIGWMVLKPRRRPGVADVSDLAKNPVVKWQHRNYISLLLLVAFVIPTVIPWLAWGDARGGYVYAAVLRLCFVHHVSFLPPIEFFLILIFNVGLLYSCVNFFLSPSSPHSVSTRLLTGSERLLLTTSTLLVTI